MRLILAIPLAALLQFFPTTNAEARGLILYGSQDNCILLNKPVSLPAMAALWHFAGIQQNIICSGPVSFAM